MDKLSKFNQTQLKIVSDCAQMAEELVSNFYKMSDSQWLTSGVYDIKTVAQLAPEEIIDGPFAQIIRYEGKKKDTSLGSSIYDFYKICLQDHTILSVLQKKNEIKIFPFVLYIIIHELVHIVRFCKFLQNFKASPEEIIVEETRVHEITRRILNNVTISGLDHVLKFYEKWQTPFDDLQKT